MIFIAVVKCIKVTELTFFAHIDAVKFCFTLLWKCALPLPPTYCIVLFKLANVYALLLYFLASIYLSVPLMKQYCLIFLHLYA